MNDMTPDRVVFASRLGGKYRCQNCQAEHPRLRGEGSLNEHLKANTRCSVAVLAFKKSGNVDCLDNPPYQPSYLEQLSGIKELGTAAP